MKCTSAAAWVLCTLSCVVAQNTNNLNIRLVNGGTETQGRLEVQTEDGIWGTVCDDAFGYQEAVVVCRALGFTDLSQALGHNSATYGQGSDPILLDELGCNGEETNIFDCPHNGIGINDCSHWEDAGVSCALAGDDGCLDEPDCSIPAAQCPYGLVEYVNVDHKRCPICRCASCPEEPTCPTDCASGKTEYYVGFHCQRCRCVPHDWPTLIIEPNSISVVLMVVVVIIALVIPLIVLIVVIILKRNQDKSRSKARGKDRDPDLGAPKQDTWFSGGKA